MRVTVVGLGYVGLVTGACMAAWDHEVTGVDADRSRLSALDRGSLPFHEPDLDRLVTAGSVRGNLGFTDDLTGAAATADAVIIAVGTHDGNGGWQTDTIRACLAQVVPVMRDDATLVIRSTLPPDFVRSVCGLIDGLRAAEGRRPIPALLNPEFTREGRAVHDFQHPERIVLGVLTDPERRGETTLREIYRDAAAPVLVMSAIDASLTKLGANLFLATKISFANELADLCDAYEADVTTVVDGMSYDGRIGGSFLRAGVGFGGSCLPNQVAMTIRTAAAVGVDTPLLSAVAQVNGRRRELVVERAAHLLGGTVRQRRIALLGLTFKPDTDDLRDAPSLDIARGLLAAGATVSAYDPMPTARARSSTLVPGLEVFDHPLEALRGADAAVIVTEWREFLDLDWASIAPTMRRQVIIDGRNLLSGDRLAEAGFTYTSFGRGTLEPALVDAMTAATPMGLSIGWGDR
jgi:UDPglucose 6-dehydrogenase